ncbi:MAG: T9SS type A sorting domain-containing protein [Bacteroidetes bacterium]|nr:T9SS type A sorting domain-containing protein [Bacteroidota bacterium]
MKTFTKLVFLVLLLSVKPLKAQFYTAGDISTYVNENFFHDSTWCWSMITVEHLITIQNSFVGDIVQMKDETTGNLVASETNLTGASPWNVILPVVNSNPIVQDNWLSAGIAFFAGPPIKIICGPDTIYNITNMFAHPVPDACTYGSVTGMVYADFNNDCIFNGSDIPLQNVQVSANAYMSSPSVGTISSGAYSGTNGSYYNQIQESWLVNFDVFIPSNYQFIFPLSVCNPGTFNFTSLSQTNVDFAMQCSGNLDVRSYVGGPVNARPMMPFLLYPSVSNTGCDTTSGTLTLILDSRVTYNAALSSNPASVVNGDTLIWYYSNLSNLSNGAYWNSFSAGVHLTPDITVNIGDTLCFYTSTTVPASDADITNNNSYSCIPIVNSFDPNMKEVIPAGDGPLGYIPEGTGKLTYKVHFQNTGTAEAYNISIIDTLESDIITGSFRFLSTSHTCSPEWLAPNIVKFNFYNIMLPDSNTNEPQSHGYVQFSVEIDSSLAPGTSIENTAYIYFDFNAPIVTNTAVNTIEIPLGIENVAAFNDLILYPNPTSGKITISTKNNEVLEVQIFNVMGEMVYRNSIQSGKEINLSELAKGFYQVKSIGRNNEMKINKLLIQ